MAPRAKDYFKSLSSDLPASIVVFLVALPLCLGVALASNAPLFSGIIAGIVGGIVVGLFSKSHLSVSGPAAGLTAIVAAAIAIMPSFEAFLLAVIICGILQFALGVAKLGIIGNYVPGSVIKGMLAAIGLILILNQFPHLLGNDMLPVTDENVKQVQGNIFSNFFNAFFDINNSALIIGLTCLVFYFIWEKFTANKKGFIRLIPAPLIVVFIGVGLNAYFISSNSGAALDGTHLVNIPIANSAGEFFSFFTFPSDWSHLGNKDLWFTAITLALVASLESLLSIEAVDDLDPHQRVTPTNRELKAQGLGNITSGLLGGLPVTSVIVRSSANVNSGAKTKVSAILHGFLLLLCVAFIPAILNLIPKAALAAILIYTGYKLAKPSLFKAYYKKGWDQFIPLVVTVVSILLTDLLMGVLIGMAVGLFFILRSNFRSAVFVVNDNSSYHFRLRKDVSFLNKPIIKSKLEKVPENGSVLIDLSRADFIDQDIVETIEDFLLHAHLKGITVQVKRSLLRDHGFSEQILAAIDSGNMNLTRSHDKKLKTAH